MPAHFPAGSPALTFSSECKNRPHVLVPRKLENVLFDKRRTTQHSGPPPTPLEGDPWSNRVRSALSLGGLRAISRATALAFARVFAFATVVACLTSAFAFAGVLSLASVF